MNDFDGINIVTMEDITHSVIFYDEDIAANRKVLFEEALEFAKQGKVLYILNEELSELPQLSQDYSSVTTHYMKMISFLYVKTQDSLLESLSTLPDWHNIPSTIILDDLNSFSGNNIQSACGTVAFLIDTIHSCSKVLQTSCRLFISISKDNVTEEYCNALKELYCNRHKDSIIKLSP